MYVHTYVRMRVHIRTYGFLYSSDVIVSFSPLTYTVMEDGNVVVRLEADKMAGVDYTIEVTQVNGGQ